MTRSMMQMSSSMRRRSATAKAGPPPNSALAVTVWLTLVTLAMSRLMLASSTGSCSMRISATLTLVV